MSDISARYTRCMADSVLERRRVRTCMPSPAQRKVIEQAASPPACRKPELVPWRWTKRGLPLVRAVSGSLYSSCTWKSRTSRCTLCHTGLLLETNLANLEVPRSFHDMLFANDLLRSKAKFRSLCVLPKVCFKSRTLPGVEGDESQS